MFMTTKVQEQAQDLELFLAEANPGTTVAAAVVALDAIKRKAKRLHRVYERQCNGHKTWDGRWDEAAANKDEKLEEKLVDDITAILAQFGLTVFINSDPRGNPIGFHTPKTKRYNTLGGAKAGWRL